MKATSYSLLAALVSAVGFQHSQCYAAEHGKPYFRNALKPIVDSKVLERRDVTVVPVTVVVGPDGKPTTLSETSTTTFETATPTPKKSAEEGLLDLLDDTLGITVGLDGVVSSEPQPTEQPSTTSSLSSKLTDGITYSGGGTAGTTSTESATSALETSSHNDLTKVMPTLPGFPDWVPPSSDKSTTLASRPSSSIPVGDNSTSAVSETVSSETTSSVTVSSDYTSSSVPTTSVEETASSPSGILPTLTQPIPAFPTLFPPHSSPASNTTVLPTTSSSSFPTASTNSTTIPAPTSIPSGVFPPPESSWGTGIPTARPTMTSSAYLIPSPSSQPTVTPTTASTTPTTSSTPEETTSTTPVFTEPEQPTAPPPISTNDETTMVVPTEIVYQPPPTHEPTPTTTEPGYTPPSVPGHIAPPDGGWAIPANSRLVQLGFKRELNYDFVAKHSNSVSQIIAFVPQGVSYGLGIELPQVYMHKLSPYEGTVDYRATLAMMYIPEDLVDKLGSLLANPLSALFTHPNPPIAAMMAMVDPTIPLIPGQDYHNKNPGGSNPGSPGGPGDDDDSGKGGHKDNGGGDGSDNTSGVKASAVGIGLGVVGGAALYGAAMFFVARRYRRKRRMHHRTSSLTSGLDDRSSGAVSPSEGLMGANYRDSHGSGGGGSARTAMISAPVMSENSLGWN